MTVITIPRTTSIRPTRTEMLALRGLAAIGTFIASRMARRAARLGVYEARRDHVERERDAGVARVLGMYPR